ncbi:MAG: S49 family peptidase, partial [Gammaproteobacteria bacterium]|nr:S49 family peptidase [Gammaproteobacteria bacterium]
MNEEQNGTTPPKWERDLINRLSFAALAEQRRTRRWGIFFKFLLFAYLFMITAVAFRESEVVDMKVGGNKHTAMVEVSGMISDASEANADTIIEGLQDAFEDKDTKGVVLRINSPGGSPVQSALIYDEIRRLRALYADIPVYAVILDVGASGSYFIASAADQIYVNESSIVGSIGVLMNGFGFTGAMEKMGVERRLLTAGEHKGGLDPFTPLNEDDVAHIKKLLATIHDNFIQAVKTGRGDRLKDHPDLFSGRFWSGKQSIEMGLADELGDVNYVAREIIEAEDVVDFTPKIDLFSRFADRVGTSISNSIGLNRSQ